MLNKVILVLIALAVVKSSLTVYSIKEQLIQEGLESKAWTDLYAYMRYREMSDSTFKAS